MPDLWTRIRKARLFQVLVTYAVIAWIILQVADVLEDTLELPSWVAAATLLILLAGLPILLATAWLTAHPPAAPEADGVVTPRERVVHRWVLPHFTWRRAPAYGAIALGLLLIVAIVVVRPLGERLGPSEARADVAGVGLAVLPFSVRGADQELWGEGMVDLLSTNLDGVAGLRTIDPATVLARMPSGESDLAKRLDVARAVRARYALIGSAVAAGRVVRLSAEIHDVEADSIVARAQVENVPDSVLAMVDRLSIDLVRQLASSGQPESGLRNAQTITTSSLDALRAYLEGERLYRVGDLPGAASAYDRAIREDSAFALAYWGLSWAQGWVADSAAGAASDSTFARLVRLSDRLPERTRMFVRGDSLRRAGDFSSIGVFESSVARYPDDPEAWYMLGEVRFHQGDDANLPYRQRIEPFLRAIALDPSQATYYYHPIPNLIALQDTIAADTLIDRFLAFTGDSAHADAWRLAREVYSPAVALDREALRARLRGASRLEFDEVMKSTAWSITYPVAVEVVAQEALRAGVPPRYIGGLDLLPLIEQGRLRELVDKVVSGPYPPFVVPLVVWFARYLGADVEPELVDRYLGVDYMDGAASIWIGLDAWSQGDRARLQAAIAKLDSRARAASDPAARAGTNFQRDALRALDQPSSAAGRRAAADSLAQVIERARHMTNTSVGLEIILLRETLADLYTDTGRPREALAIFEPFASARPAPVMALRLARAHDALGEREAALRNYAIFLEGWKNGDAGLAPLAEARAALARLTAESGR